MFISWHQCLAVAVTRMTPVVSRLFLVIILCNLFSSPCRFNLTQEPVDEIRSKIVNVCLCKPIFMYQMGEAGIRTAGNSQKLVNVALLDEKDVVNIL